MRSTQKERWKITDGNQYRRHILARSWGLAGDWGQHFLSQASLCASLSPAWPECLASAVWVQFSLAVAPLPLAVLCFVAYRFIAFVSMKMALPWAWSHLLLGPSLIVSTLPECNALWCLIIVRLIEKQMMAFDSHRNPLTQSHFIVRKLRQMSKALEPG